MTKVIARVHPFHLMNVDCVVRLHRYAKHKTRPVGIDVSWSVCMYVRLSVGHNREQYRKDEPIDVLFGVWTRVD